MGSGLLSYDTELKWTKWTSLCCRLTPEVVRGDLSVFLFFMLMTDSIFDGFVIISSYTQPM